MTTSKQIRITKLDILEHFICLSENCTIAEARKVIMDASMEVSLTESGELVSIVIEI